jgi:hypothetical protein
VRFSKIQVKKKNPTPFFFHLKKFTAKVTARFFVINALVKSSSLVQNLLGIDYKK